MSLTVSSELPPASPNDLEAVNAVVSKLLGCDEVEIPTDHFLHAGCYVRTCMVPEGAAIVGALIKIPTVVIVSGECEFNCGQSVKAIHGFSVMKAAQGRRQVFIAKKDTFITMIFASSAKSVFDAEKEFTDEWELLTTNSDGGIRRKL